MELSNIKSFIKDSYIRFSDSQCPLSGEIAKNHGVYKVPLDNDVLSVISSISVSLEKLLIKKKFKKIFEEKIGSGLFFYDFCISFPEVHALLNQKIVSCIKDYLGRDAVLDAVSLFVLPLSGKYVEGKNESDLWHHDSVGHRIKLFYPICNNLSKSFAPHQYIKRTNLNKWGKYKNAINEKGERLSYDQITNKHEIEEIPMELGNAFMIDTNGIHRGLYPSDDSLRCVIQFEFSNLAKKYLPGYVGPVNFQVPEICIQKWSKLGIIRNGYFSKGAAGYSQKGRALKENEKFQIHNIGN